MKKIFFLLIIFISVFSFAQELNKESYIKKESIGGKLDFTKKVEEKYSNATSIMFGDTSYSKKDYTILLWAANVRTLGIESLDQAIKFWEDINKRNLSEPEKKALKIGFEAKF